LPETSPPAPDIRLKQPLRVIRIHPDHPATGPIRQAAAAIRNQGVVVFPTRCLYGLAADARDPAAIRKIFQIKHRPDTNPLLVLIDRPADLKTLAAQVPEAALKLMQAFWPGGLTLVFDAAPGVSRLLTAGTGKIGVRIPAHPVARALVRAVGGPITGTSANLSGDLGCSRVNDLSHDLIQAADLVLDAGPLKGGTGSTVLDITGASPRILRAGAISMDIIQQIAGDAIGKKQSLTRIPTKFIDKSSNFH
jgi:L-threonylcarbamoyladenylate synthase